MSPAPREGATETVVDARGHRCPVPTLRLRRALERGGPGATVLLLSDDPMARVDVPHFVAQAGHELVETTSTEGGGLGFRVRRSPWADGGDRGLPSGPG